MTLLFTDGFDLYNTQPNKGWQSIGSFGGSTFAASASFPTGRFGSGQALSIGKGNSNGTGAGAQQNLGVNKATLIVGSAWQSNYFGEGILRFFDGATEQLSVRTDATGHLQVSRNGTTLATETNIVIAINTWYYIELKVTFAGGTSGSYAVRRNGVTVAGIPDATGVNTIATANAFANSIVLMDVNTNVNPGGQIYDDLFVCDNLGSVNNDFLGDVRVIGLLPNGAGTIGPAFTKVGAAATNWQSVNENPPNGDTTYVSATTIGTVETYTFTDLPGTAAGVLAVSGEPVARKDDTGGRSVTTHVLSGGSEADAPTSSLLSLVYVNSYQNIMELNPVTSAPWTQADVNAAEFGPKVTA